MYHSNMLVPEKTAFRVMLICIAVLAIYYPAIFAEVSLVDDLDMVNALMNTDTMSLRNIFIPRDSAGGYYRPLLGLSQYIDRQFWMMDSTVMHFENVLFHLINAVLVYLLADRLSGRSSLKKGSLAPLAAALIFALHPIATESVDWISGRTDSLACNFILVSAIFIFRYRDDGGKLNLMFSAFALMLSVFAKEVAFGYILALPFLFTSSEGSAVQNGKQPAPPVGSAFHQLITFLLFFAVSVIVAMYLAWYWAVIFLGFCYLLYSLWLNNGKKNLLQTVREHLVATGVLALVTAATFALFFVVRKIAFTSSINRIANTFKLIFQDTSYAISIFLGSAGFYVKKFFLPLPLNFFILEVNPLYDLVGIAVFLLALWLIIRRSIIPALSITGMCCVLPAFPFAFGTIAWTGYAERYIYVASAFWSIALAFFVARLCAGRNVLNIPERLINAFFLVLLTAMAGVTYQRNITWQTNKALIADTVAQSPNKKDLRGLYMLAFIRAGDYKSAREQYRIASTLYSVKYLENYDLNMAGIEAAEGNKIEAEALLNKVLNDPKANPATALRFYVKFLENELTHAKDPSDTTELQNKIISLYNRLHKLNNDPFVLYRLGQIYISRKDTQSAIEYFEQAAQAYPPGNMYGDNSSMIAKKLRLKIQQ